VAVTAPVLDWAAVRERYTRQPTVRALTGESVLRVLSVDDDRLCLGQRLWRDCLTRAELETALTLVRPGLSPVEFAEVLRRYYAGGPQVRTGCTRTPNLAAIVLRDLGHLAP
jgi:hypothetical protein